MVEANAQQAFDYYQKGAQQDDTNCRCRLARCYAQGIGTVQNHEKALELCQAVLKKRYPLNELEDFGTRAELKQTKAIFKDLSKK